MNGVFSPFLVASISSSTSEVASAQIVDTCTSCSLLENTKTRLFIQPQTQISAGTLDTTPSNSRSVSSRLRSAVPARISSQGEEEERLQGHTRWKEWPHFPFTSSPPSVGLTTGRMETYAEDSRRRDSGSWGRCRRTGRGRCRTHRLRARPIARRPRRCIFGFSLSFRFCRVLFVVRGGRDEAAVIGRGSLPGARARSCSPQ